MEDRMGSDVPSQVQKEVGFVVTKHMKKDSPVFIKVAVIKTETNFTSRLFHQTSEYINKFEFN